MSEVRQAAEEYFITTLPHMVETKEDREYWFRPGNSKTIDAFIAGSEYLTPQLEALKKERDELKEENRKWLDSSYRARRDKNDLIFQNGLQKNKLAEAIKVLEQVERTTRIHKWEAVANTCLNTLTKLRGGV